MTPFDANDLDARLAPVADKYRETKVREPGELPPDGDYQARIEKFDVWESKSDELFLSTILVVVTGDEKGAELKTIHALENPDRLDFLKRHLLILGVDTPDELAGLRARLGAVVGRIVEARVATADKVNPSTGERYRNVYVNKVISANAGVPVNTSDFVAPVPASAADEDIPF